MCRPGVLGDTPLAFLTNCYCLSLRMLAPLWAMCGELGLVRVHNPIPNTVIEMEKISYHIIILILLNHIKLT